MKKLFFLITVLISVSSCQYDPNEPTPVSFGVSEGVQFKDGRLVFSSKEAFQLFYAKYADASEFELEKVFQPLYRKGFYSLRPVVTNSNADFIFEHYQSIIMNDHYEKTNVGRADEDIFDYLDDFEDLIGDDAFAAFLNSDSEIQIFDKIYKYTDAGLFIAKEDKYSVLNNFLDLKLISKNPIVKTSDSAKEAFKAEYPNSGITMIDSDIDYFKNNYIEPIFYDGEGNPSSSGGGVGAPSTYYPNIGYPFDINLLQYCDPRQGIFGDLFGENDICIDRYETRRRVKTKAYNYDFLLFYHLGVKVKHQWRDDHGLWRSEATDEVRIVVEAAQFTYDLAQLTGANAVNSQTRERYYFLNNSKIAFIPTASTPFPSWGDPFITNFDPSSLPPVFSDGLGIEFFGTGSATIDNAIHNALSNFNVPKKLNEHFYNALKSEIDSQLQQYVGGVNNIPVNRTLFAKFPELGKMYVQKSYLSNGINISTRQQTFDWGGEIRITATEGSGGQWSLSGGAGNQLARPSGFKVKMCGAARHNGIWHGSKINAGIE